MPASLASTVVRCPQTDVKYKLAMRAKKPEQRLRTFLGFCQPKKECPYTNAPQPMYRIDGMRIMMEFPKPKADDEMPAEQADRKQVRGTQDRLVLFWEEGPCSVPLGTSAIRSEPSAATHSSHFMANAGADGGACARDPEAHQRRGLPCAGLQPQVCAARLDGAHRLPGAAAGCAAVRHDGWRQQVTSREQRRQKSSTQD